MTRRRRHPKAPPAPDSTLVCAFNKRIATELMDRLALPPQGERAWSPQQQEIFGWVSDAAGHLVVRALAGTGKTTTILEGARRHGRPITASTLHSAGWKCVRTAWPGVRFDEDRGRRLADLAWQKAGDGKQGPTPRAVARAIAKLAEFVKGMAPRASPDDCLNICLGMNVEVDGELADDYPPERLADLARRALGLAAQPDGTCDYNDMLWVPVEHRLMRPTYPLLIVDEAQDMNRTQTDLALGLASDRIIVVGDPNQAIYGFRGADSQSMKRLHESLAADTRPLTITYRCPQTVVRLAKELVPDFTAHDTAPEGHVLHCDVPAMLARAAPGDFVLSRTNAPLAGICLALLRQGKPARIQGRDIGASLSALVRRMRASSMSDLTLRLHRHLEAERKRLTTEDGEQRAAAASKLEMLTEQVTTLDALSEGLSDPLDLLRRLEALFTDVGPAGQIVCSSVHKAKGLESHTVYVLEWTLYCNGSRLDDQEEKNIHYVAITRAMNTLVLVSRPETGDPT